MPTSIAAQPMSVPKPTLLAVSKPIDIGTKESPLPETDKGVKVPKSIDATKAFTIATKLLESVQSTPITAGEDNQGAMIGVAQALTQTSSLLQQARSDLERKIPAARDLSTIIGAQATQLAFAAGQLSTGADVVTAAPPTAKTVSGPTDEPAAEPTATPAIKTTFGEMTGPIIPQVIKNATLAIELLQKQESGKQVYPGYL